VVVDLGTRVELCRPNLVLVSFPLFLFQSLLHVRPRIATYIPEAAMVILVGMVAGLLVYLIVGGPSDDYADPDMADGIADSLLSFSPTVFFIILLPPVIFNSGYHLRRDLFFRYMTPICLFACLGTIICALFVAGILQAASPLFEPYLKASFLEFFAFGALISATDPVSTLAVFSSKKVDPHLFYLVFGESVINDAVGLVLFDSLAHLIEIQINQQGQLHVGQEVLQFFFDFVVKFVGSLCLGFLSALLYAVFFKYVRSMDKTPALELCAFLTIMYFPFVVAEVIHQSGIVTVLFAGIAAKRYVVPNLSSGTVEKADYLFRLVAHLTETVIFLELGLSVVGLSTVGSSFQSVFIVISLGACLVGRAIHIYPITYVYNMVVSRLRKRRKNKQADPEPFDYTNAVETELVEQSVDKKEGDPSTPDTSFTSTVSTSSASSTESVNDAVIPWKTAHMLWFSGLRGAVSYGLVRTFPQTGNQNVFIMTTMMIILITTFGLGGTTGLALKCLKIDVEVDETTYLERIDRKHLLHGWLRRFESYTLRRWVIRDFVKLKEDEAERQSSDGVYTTRPAVCEDTDSIDSNYVEYNGEDDDSEVVELTERDHLRAIVDYEPSKGIYDFGQ